jgi:hypothetical protein
VKRLVMVAGAGRSGTSTVAGALTMLGLHLPQPEVPADETNPRGFYETQWVVDFHKSLLERSPVIRTLDARPEVAALAEERPTDEDAARLAEWLTEQLAHDQVLVKDPRAFWFHDVWRRTTTALGAETAFLTMLRHPAEVAKSRDTWYTPDIDEDFRRHRATANVAGWCNAAFVTERITRGDRRTFVRYTDLLADWRSALVPVRERLSLELNADLWSAAHHPVDDFIDSGLRRSETTWDSVDLPETLRVIAEATWEQLNLLADDPTDATAGPALERLQRDYEQVHDHAVAVALDHTRARETHVRRNAKANTRAELEGRIHDLEQQVAELSAPKGRRWGSRSPGSR